MVLVFGLGIIWYEKEHICASPNGWRRDTYPEPAGPDYVMDPGINYKVTPVRPLHVDSFWRNVQKMCLTFQRSWKTESCKGSFVSYKIIFLFGIMARKSVGFFLLLANKIQSAIGWAKTQVCWKFNWKHPSSFCLIWLTNHPTNQQNNKPTDFTVSCEDSQFQLLRDKWAFWPKC